MATESTAIVNLIDLVRNRELPKAADDDLLFGGKARFDATAMPVQTAPVTLSAPAPIVARPATKVAGPAAKVRPAYDHVRLSQMRLADTQAIRAAGPSPLVKKVVAGGCAFVAVMVVLAVYLAKRDSSPSAALAESTPKPTVAVVTPPEPVAPVVTPIEPKVETTVTPIETAPSAEPTNKFSTAPALQPTVPTGPVVTPEESPAVAAASAPVAKVAKKSSRKSSSRAAKRAKAQKREMRVAIAEPAKKNVKLGGKGQLAIANTSGGDIWVDGRKPTSSRMTLEPGKHNITMFDKKTRKAKTFQVEIKPNQTTTVRR